MNKVIRYWVSAGTARRGWEIRKVALDANGKEIDGGLHSKGYAHKAANDKVKELNASLNGEAEPVQVPYIDCPLCGYAVKIGSACDCEDEN